MSLTKEAVMEVSGENRFDEEGGFETYSHLVAKVEFYAQCAKCGRRSIAQDQPDDLDGWKQAHRCP